MDGSGSNNRPPSPTPSCVSMKSNDSMPLPINFNEGDFSTGLVEANICTKNPPSPTPTCVSIKSDDSMPLPINFTGDSSTGQVEDASSSKRPPSPNPTCVSMKSDDSMPLPINFTGDSSTGQFKGATSKDRPPSPTPTCVSMKSDDSMPLPINFTGDSSTGQVTSTSEKQATASANTLSEEQHSDGAKSFVLYSSYQQSHKSDLLKFQCLVEGIPQQGDTRLLHEFYTELYIIEGGRGEVNDEHEVKQIERESLREAAHSRPIKCSDIFKPLFEQDKPIRTVLTKGVAGIGKTVSVHKFILDWVEGKANQDIHFIFPLPFRELNLMKEKKLSLVSLIQHFFPGIKGPRVFTSLKNRVLFILDGLDESRLPLDFHNNPRCCDVTKRATVDMLITNLIDGDLLPTALLWITTRPAAAKQIPPKCVSLVTEIRGFNDSQKKEYFRKIISDENLASRTITHLKSSRSLYIMCHIPIFCWISATVVESTSGESEKVEMPRTLTQMYTHFLIIQTSIKKSKYTDRKERDEEVIFKLGKLAFQQLEKGNLIFYEEDLRQCGIDVTEASVYSGVCTQIFREEFGLSQGKVFSFVHLSIQEFLAALYVFLCFSNQQRQTQTGLLSALFRGLQMFLPFRNRQRDMPDQQQISQLSDVFRAAILHDLHKTAVDLALQSENGHLDLFLRFLLGLSLESNHNLLRHLLPQCSSQSQSSEQTVQYVKQNIRDQYRSDRRINLFYCLNELNHHTVVEVIDRSSGTLYVDMLLPGEWETKRFGFEMPEEQLAEFDLQKYIETPEKDQTERLSPDEVLQKLLPVVTTATSARFWDCSLTEKSCSCLVSALTAHTSSLRLLNLDKSKVLDSGVKLLCSGLRHQNCQLEELWLQSCNLTEKSCSYLASALTSHSSSLKELNLSNDKVLDSGVKLLSSALRHQNCMLEKLQLRYCSLTEKSCSYLATVLISQYSRLKLLNLRGNNLQDSGVKLLCNALHQNCKLEELKLYDCNVTEKSCSHLIAALTSPSSGLRVLDLRRNDLSEKDAEPLSALVKDQNCKLEKLVLWG